jgi:hypothetical protein
MIASSDNPAVCIRQEFHYGLPEEHLLRALQTGESLRLQRIEVKAKSLPQMFEQFLIWVPLAWALLFFFPLRFLGFGQTAFPIAIILGFGLSLTKKHLVRGFLSRRQSVMVQELCINFSTKELIATEQYEFAPEKDSREVIGLANARPKIRWVMGDCERLEHESDRIEVILASTDVEIWSIWPTRVPVLFLHECDSSIASQKAEAEKRANEVAGMLVRRMAPGPEPVERPHSFAERS